MDGLIERGCLRMFPQPLGLFWSLSSSHRLSWLTKQGINMQPEQAAREQPRVTDADRTHGGKWRLQRGFTSVRCHRQAHHHHIRAPLTVDSDGLEVGGCDRGVVGSNLQTSKRYWWGKRLLPVSTTITTSGGLRLTTSRMVQWRDTNICKGINQKVTSVVVCCLF